MSKVFGVGMIKTGTCSFARCMKVLGFNHLDGGFKIGNQLANSYMSGDYRAILSKAHNYESFEDFPWCAPGFYRLLDTKFPESKFVLTIRSAESWYDSLRRMCKPSFNTSGIEPDILEISKRSNELPVGRFYGLIIYLLATFGTLDIADNKGHIIDTYNNYNNSIIDYFNKGLDNRLLVVDWEAGDGWEKLCKFLGKKIPNTKFPHLNIDPNKSKLFLDGKAIPLSTG
jgi:hypothetical protein